MKIYCSGIGGIGLSAYAALQASNGHTVLGSDRSDSALLQDLRSQGIDISLSQDGSHVQDDCDLFVYSEAIPTDAPERVRAKEKHIRSISYFEALGELSHDFFVIAVCGTHGKSSTTAMAAKVLMEAGLDPTVVVGTKSPDLDGRNWRRGESELFLVEACEYRTSFLHLKPDLVLMTNVDGDHFDAFSSMHEYRDAFITFVRSLPAEGAVVTHLSDAECAEVAQASERSIIDADTLPLPDLSVPGMHMRENARLVMALAKHLKIDPAGAERSLKNFQGTWRRMEVLGDTPQGVTVVDDYGHHPREIRATLAAMRERFPERRIVCVFQPHTHDRTRKLYDDFIRAFTGSDLTIIPNIYVARSDIETGTVDVDAFVADIAKGSGIETMNGHSLTQTEQLLKDSILKSGDVLLCMGAGNITDVASAMMGTSRSSR